MTVKPAQEGAVEALLRLTFVGCLILLPLSCWQRDEIGDDLDILANTGRPPVQRATDQGPFPVRLNGVAYQVEPVYDYDLHGLVVSYEHHDGESMLHRAWNDHLNVADVCVLWGRNASALDLSLFEFWNGQFTCFFRTKDQDAWRAFDQAAISNNHLISADMYLRDRIEQVRIGDQIHVRGWLANYRNDDVFYRTTSTSRTDRGNGACETIYVNDFEILSSMHNPWRFVYQASLTGVSAAGLLWLFVVMSGRSPHRVRS